MPRTWVRAMALLAILITLSYSPTIALAQSPSPNETWRFRLVWGGGAPRRYQGTIRLEGAKLKHHQTLGVRPQSVLEIVPTSDNSLDILSPDPTQFLGTDLELVGNRNSRISVHLEANQPNQPAFDQSYSFAELEAERQFAPLDPLENRCFVDRVPGDRLRVDSPTPHLVFRTNQTVSFSITPFHTGLAEGPATLHAKLVHDASQTSLHEESFAVQLDPSGNAPPISLSTQAPQLGGAYSWHLSLEPKRRFGSLLSTTQTVSRQLQWVVAEPTPTDPTDEPWKPIQSIDLFASPNNNRPLLRLLTSDDTPQAANSAPLEARIVDGQRALVLPPEAWRMVPLEITELGKPHRIVLHAPGDRTMQCVALVVERNTKGEWESASLETGFHIPKPTSQTVEHQFVYWPKSQTAQLLLYNPNTTDVASLLRAELWAGPKHLAQLSEEERQLRKQDPRNLAVAIHPVDWLKQLGVPPTLDPETQRPIPDWHALYLATQRLIEYCHWTGVNAIAMQSLGDGSSIHPTQNLHSNLRWEQGTFFSDARDPIRKDLLELLLHRLDDEGLRLYMTWDWNAPLLELEQAKPTPNSFTSLQQTNPLALPWSEVHQTSHPLQRRYHPLHPAYQRLIDLHLTDVAKRYQHHPSWIGIILRLSPKSHSQFINAEWGADPQLLNQFARAENLQLPENPEERNTLLQGSLRHDWLQWRALQLRQSWTHAQTRLQKLAPGRKWIVDPSLLLDPDTKSQQPSSLNDPWNPERLLLEQGIASFDSNSPPNTIQPSLLRTEWDSPLASIVERKRIRLLSQSQDLDKLSLGASTLGSIWIQPTFGLPLDGLDRPNADPDSTSRLWIYPNLAMDSDNWRNAILRRLAISDQELLIFQGLGSIPVLQPSIRDTLRALAKLPSRTFHSIPFDERSDSGNNVVLRASHDGAKSHFYLFNQSPWTETVHLEWLAPDRLQCEWQFQADTSLSIRRDETGFPSTISLAPFQLITFDASDPLVRIDRWRHHAQDGLRATILPSLERLTQQVNRTATPQSSYQLENPGFESPSNEKNSLPGWKASILPTTQVAVEDRIAYEGSHSLRMENQSKQGYAWVLSPSLPPPITGRLSLECFVHCPPNAPPPQLTLTTTLRKNDGSKSTHTYPILIEDKDPKLVDPTGTSPDKTRWRYCTLTILKDAPPDSFSELQFSLDLKSTGSVWIDNLRINDYFLTDEERRSLRADLFLATREMERGNFSIAQRLLESYWSEFLDHFDWADPNSTPHRSSDHPSDRKHLTSTNANSKASTNNNTPSPVDDAEDNSKGVLDRDRPWLKKVREGFRRNRSSHNR